MRSEDDNETCRFCWAYSNKECRYGCKKFTEDMVGLVIVGLIVVGVVFLICRVFLGSPEEFEAKSRIEFRENLRKVDEKEAEILEQRLKELRR